MKLGIPSYLVAAGPYKGSQDNLTYLHSPSNYLMPCLEQQL